MVAVEGMGDIVNMVAFIAMLDNIAVVVNGNTIYNAHIIRRDSRHLGS